MYLQDMSEKPIKSISDSRPEARKPLPDIQHRELTFFEAIIEHYVLSLLCVAVIALSVGTLWIIS